MRLFDTKLDGKMFPGIDNKFWIMDRKASKRKTDIKK